VKERGLKLGVQPFPHPLVLLPAAVAHSPASQEVHELDALRLTVMRLHLCAHRRDLLHHLPQEGCDFWYLKPTVLLKSAWLMDTGHEENISAGFAKLLWLQLNFSQWLLVRATG